MLTEESQQEARRWVISALTLIEMRARQGGQVKTADQIKAGIGALQRGAWLNPQHQAVAQKIIVQTGKSFGFSYDEAKAKEKLVALTPPASLAQPAGAAQPAGQGTPVRNLFPAVTIGAPDGVHLVVRIDKIEIKARTAQEFAAAVNKLREEEKGEYSFDAGWKVIGQRARSFRDFSGQVSVAAWLGRDFVILEKKETVNKDGGVVPGEVYSYDWTLLVDIKDPTNSNLRTTFGNRLSKKVLVYRPRSEVRTESSLKVEERMWKERSAGSFEGGQTPVTEVVPPLGFIL